MSWVLVLCLGHLQCPSHLCMTLSSVTFTWLISLSQLCMTFNSVKCTWLMSLCQLCMTFSSVIFAWLMSPCQLSMTFNSVTFAWLMCLSQLCMTLKTYMNDVCQSGDIFPKMYFYDEELGMQVDCFVPYSSMKVWCQPLQKQCTRSRFSSILHGPSPKLVFIRWFENEFTQWATRLWMLTLPCFFVKY